MEFNSKPTKETQNNWSRDPNNWIGGIFYYNPQDKRLFPPKKIKQLGWTINFANPNSLCTAIAIIAVLLISTRNS
ncbi:DUF5808 domain-containing protein [Flavobacterium sp. N502540]|uniref:DUF5808 domain-containing protein n=1 Tax=Flavobacterium sp. N502540 TaxID=2986838 RepID=UPI0022242DBE|nr:DUF5808 domain-containing protein [Flavobacterium sp. N502540]